MIRITRIALACLTLGSTAAMADTTYHVLANGSFSQDWSNVDLITVNDNWDGVPSMQAFRGDALASGTGADPRLVLAFGSSPLNVNANDTAPSTASSGGVYEVQGGTEIGGNPTIAFQGSGTAKAPFVLLRINTTGCTNLNLKYKWRDIDTAELTPNQQVVVQSRIGESGNFAVVPDTYIAIANTNGVIDGDVVLPVALENQAQIQLRWLTTDAPNTDAMIGIDDIEVTGSCTGGVDNPPTVVNTSPANGASGVLSSAVLSVQFSEAVQTATGWFNLSCNSTPVSVNEAGTGSTRTLTPVSGLPFGASCTGTITGSLVTDIDGVTQDPVAGNPSFSFTVQADIPPSVASTAPTAGQSNVAVGANIVLNFSEPVTTTGSWYSLSCGGNVPAVASGTGATRILDPVDPLPASTACTLTLNNALVTDLDGTPDPLAGPNFTLSFTTNAGGSDYYSSVDATSAATLRSSLHNLIDDHTVFPYTDNSGPNAIDVWKMVEQAEEDPTESDKILDIYRNRKFVKVADRVGANTQPPPPLRYNREHSWPNSLGFGLSDSQGRDGQGRIVAPYTDGHMLFASDETYNGNRGNKRFDNCPNGCAENPTVANHGAGGGTGVYPGQSNWNGSSVYEVWAGRKGDLARAILYMDVRYEGGFSPNGAKEPDLVVTNNAGLIVGTGSGVVADVAYMGILNTLLAWHAADPPDAKECYRNEVIFSHQGNRNPFIDHPEFATCLWGASCPGIQASACGGGVPQPPLLQDGFESP